MPYVSVYGHVSMHFRRMQSKAPISRENTFFPRVFVRAFLRKPPMFFSQVGELLYITRKEGTRLRETQRISRFGTNLITSTRLETESLMKFHCRHFCDFSRGACKQDNNHILHMSSQCHTRLQLLKERASVVWFRSLVL